MSALVTAATCIGWTVLDGRGRWIGTVQRVHLNHTTGRPEWITVRVGRWVTTRQVAPLAGSTLWCRALRLPYDRSAIRHAPPIMNADQMNVDEQFALYSHYLQSVAPSSP